MSVSCWDSQRLITWPCIQVTCELVAAFASSISVSSWTICSRRSAHSERMISTASSNRWTSGLFKSPTSNDFNLARARSKAFVAEPSNYQLSYILTLLLTHFDICLVDQVWWKPAWGPFFFLTCPFKAVAFCLGVAAARFISTSWSAPDSWSTFIAASSSSSSVAFPSPFLTLHDKEHLTFRMVHSLQLNWPRSPRPTHSLPSFLQFAHASTLTALEARAGVAFAFLQGVFAIGSSFKGEASSAALRSTGVPDKVWVTVLWGLAGVAGFITLTLGRATDWLDPTDCSLLALVVCKSFLHVRSRAEPWLTWVLFLSLFSEQRWYLH